MKFIPRIYYPYPLQRGEQVVLEKTIAHYLMTVLRLKDNEQVILFNGLGGEYSAILTLDKKKASVNILDHVSISRESPLQLHLGQGLARGDRMDTVVQKATELGVMSITPLITKNCAVKLDDQRKEKRLQHWQNIAISACEQSGRTEIPTIFAPISMLEWCQQPFQGISLFFDPHSKTPLNSFSPTHAIRIAIGPESGWDEQESTFMLKQGFASATLGPRILRTETASITALSILQGLFGDFT